jgi:hypothetical protein
MYISTYKFIDIPYLVPIKVNISIIKHHHTLVLQDKKGFIDIIF